LKGHLHGRNPLPGRRSPRGRIYRPRNGAAVFTEADNINDLHTQIRDVVHCHFGECQRPSLIRLHVTREEVLVA